jgi:hypothetical protein
VRADHASRGPEFFFGFVCEFPARFFIGFAALAAFARRDRPDLLVLPERLPA